MNNQTNSVIVAIANNNEVVLEQCRELAKSVGVSSLIRDINTLWAFGALQADYVVSTEEFSKEDRGNGTGYYDPIAAAVFVDSDGEDIPNNSSICMFDNATSRRLYVIVLAPGNNIVIHDRYSKTPTPTFVMTCQISANDLIGMHSSWGVNRTADLVNMCRLFGFEFDRTNDAVYAPVWKKNNWFKQVNYHFVDNRKLTDDFGTNVRAVAVESEMAASIE